MDKKVVLIVPNSWKSKGKGKYTYLLPVAKVRKIHALLACPKQQHCAPVLLAVYTGFQGRDMIMASRQALMPNVVAGDSQYLSKHDKQQVRVRI